MLERAPSDVAAWAMHFRDAEIPVLANTIAALDALRLQGRPDGEGEEDAQSAAREDDDGPDVDVHTLAGIVSQDPLMILKVLSHVARHRSSRIVTGAETVTAAILMMGVPPFFRVFSGLTSVEDHLVAHADALQGLREVIARAERAATFALAFAVHRMDAEAEVIHEAALLHDFAELLLWCHAPGLATEIRRRQREDPTLRSAAAQEALLHIRLTDLQQALMKAWRLPDLLVSMTDHNRAQEARVRTVLLAVQLARHTQHGWDNAAIPDDVDAIARLLNLSHEATRRKLRGLAV